MQTKNNNARRRDERQRFVISVVAVVGVLQLVALRFIPWARILELHISQFYILSPPEILAVAAFLYCFGTINYRLLKSWADQEEITFLTAIVFIYWICLFPCAVSNQGILLHLLLLVGLLTIIGLYRLFYSKLTIHQESLIVPWKTKK